MNATERGSWRKGVMTMHREAGGVLELQVVQQSDVPNIVVDALEPDEDHNGAQQTRTEGMQTPRSPQ